MTDPPPDAPSTEFDRKLTELRAHEAQFQELIQSIKDYAIFWLDADGIIQSWNPGAQHIKQYRADEIIGRHFSVFYPPEDLAKRKPERELEGAKQLGRFEDEGWRLRKDGTRFWANVVITPIRDADGSLVGFSKVTRDLTERKAVEDLLRSNNEQLEQRVAARTMELKLANDRLELALLSGKLAAWDWDLETGSMPWSPTLKAIFGYGAEEQVASIRDFERRLHPDDYDRVTTAIGYTLAERSLYEVEYRVIWPDGSVHWIEAQGRGVYDDEGRAVHMLGTASLIDERKRAQEHLEALVRSRTDELVRAQASLVESAKLSALGEMAAGIAHEINTPLATILMKAQQLQRVATMPSMDAERVGNNAKAIAETSRRIATIIRGLRSFARDDSGEAFSATTAQRLIEDVLDLCRARFKSHGIDLRTEVRSEPTSLLCRPVAVAQVLVNLLNNAFDAVADPVIDPKWILIDVNETDDEVTFAVSNAGPVIPAEIRERIMQPFFTTKPLGKGTGLGLSISRGIVESHRGTLSLDDTCVHTRFVMRLPRTQEVRS